MQATMTQSKKRAPREKTSFKGIGRAMKYLTNYKRQAALPYVFLIIATEIPGAREVLNLTALNSRAWLLAIGVPFLTISWMEVKKVVQYFFTNRQRAKTYSLRDIKQKG